MKLSISLAVASFLATLTAAHPNPSPVSPARMPPTMLPNLAARDTALDPEIHRLCHWSKECIRAHEEADKKKSKGGRTCSGKKDCENAFDDLMMEMRVEIKEKAERRQKAREGKIAAPPPM